MKMFVQVLTLLALLVPVAQAQFGGASPVELSEARVTMMAPTMQVAGTVVSRSDASLAAEVEGRLIEVADVGTRVEAGDVIARIEDTPLRLRAQELAAEITRAQARLRFLEAELVRFERLAETNLAAVSQIEQTRSERDVATSDLTVVRSRLEQIEDQLERTRITAPFPGVVVERVAQAGERVAVGTRVVRLVDPASLEVVARAPLSYYRYVEPGDELGLNFADEELIAPVRTVVSVGDESRHVFELRLDLAESLPVGQTVRVTVPTANVREVLAVPRDALVLRGDGIAVFIVDEDNTARRIRVTTGIGAGDWIEVSGPIQAGDRVVIRGNERLRPGQEVSVQG
ncbi:efflux RND transporter periplasmic adaptor subunit [Wenzhouxiangella limi]|uniref:Efflux RND transporter periplasmic adaptor subunit n=1 Tax=Wenzhouxiangella limi TaxID=2707351 RepID=A0A845UVI3_9GAMM|nr:efflux RND transporter periplasmic adaptor subunit [Wenzhouxiangella limi]NDY95833.1 efflux RND transporter periplasmic adaptor subunit [Wenzhouxiangella limi]